MADIANGIPAVGEVLPKETDLAEQFGVSRFTIREALRRLEERGLVERRKRAGTKVVVSKPVPRYSLSLETTDQLMKYLGETALHVTAIARATGDDLGTHELDGLDETWWKIETYRVVPGSTLPVSWTDIFVGDAYSAILEHVGSRPGPTFPLLEEICGEIVHRIRQEVAGIGMPARIAHRLRVEPGQPSLRVVRRFFNPAEQMMELAVSYYPQGRFVYEADLVRRNG